jgi:hypothetical protein
MLGSYEVFLFFFFSIDIGPEARLKDNNTNSFARSPENPKGFLLFPQTNMKKMYKKRVYTLAILQINSTLFPRVVYLEVRSVLADVNKKGQRVGSMDRMAKPRSLSWDIML